MTSFDEDSLLEVVFWHGSPHQKTASNRRNHFNFRFNRFPLFKLAGPWATAH
jgi:hypothetical protein